MNTTPDPAALAMSAAEEIVSTAWNYGGPGVLETQSRNHVATIISRHMQPLVDRITELEKENHELEAAIDFSQGELREMKDAHETLMRHHSVITKLCDEYEDKLTAANERAERAERERDELRTGIDRLADRNGFPKSDNFIQMLEVCGNRAERIDSALTASQTSVRELREALAGLLAMDELDMGDLSILEQDASDHPVSKAMAVLARTSP